MTCHESIDHKVNLSFLNTKAMSFMYMYSITYNIYEKLTWLVIMSVCKFSSLSLCCRFLFKLNAYLAVVTDIKTCMNKVMGTYESQKSQTLVMIVTRIW